MCFVACCRVLVIDTRQKHEQEREKNRIMESRAMVAKTVAAVDNAANSRDDDDQDEESGGATNAPPNDDDDLDRNKERDAWEMRELERLLTTLDEQEERQEKKLEYERRKQMTDQECLEEDTKVGRYQKPGTSRQQHPNNNNEQQEKGKFMQRFYHRGAFYMDEEEWDEGDIRHKAVEYARAATGEDKIDKSKLPEVMQVKKFGLSGQNSRYKGLAKEDTTDKNMEMLPLSQKIGYGPRPH
jgi:microfibrillar-associated protein 1